MKSFTKILVASLALIGTVAASAQTQAPGTGFPTTGTRKPHANRRAQANTGNPQALKALQADLETAIKDMTSALPIYDGFRVRSIHATHRALLVADKALMGANATLRARPTVHDHIPSAKAKSKYSAQQIAASQAAMQQGLTALMQAVNDVKAAAGANPTKAARKDYEDIEKAIADANTAMQIHNGGGANASFSRPSFQP